MLPVRCCCSFPWLQCMPELQLVSMLAETVTEVCLTQGARALGWPPAPWLPAQLSPTPNRVLAPGQVRTAVFAASDVWAAAPSKG